MTSSSHRPLPNGHHRSAHPAHLINGSARRATSMSRDASLGGGLGTAGPGDEDERAEDPIHRRLMARWAATEVNIAALFGTDGQSRRAFQKPSAAPLLADAVRAEDSAKTSAPPKKAARTIDEDDYGDDDEDEEDEVDKQSPLKAKGKAAMPNGGSSLAVRSPQPPPKPSTMVRTNTSTSSEHAKSSEDVRKQLEEDKKAAAEAAKRSFQTMFYTFENDRDAMLEQQKLDELDREVENEISGDPNAADAQATTSGGPAAPTTQGTLGSADLGASSLTLKHLIARIDAKRDMVKASDNQLRTLISEVRKGRSKWASDERMGQEDLYEAAEKVLMELKAMTEYAQPFLQRVSKREAPDYYNIIKEPMDIGTMIKKLKQFGYKSKAEFVRDLSLIWSNCLRYNTNPEHPFRKKALYMRKETDKLTPLIPDVTVRDRAEVEAEERRMHSVDADDSDEEDVPIMASRGRKAPKKGGKGAPSTARKAPTVEVEDQSTPAPDTKPALHASASNLRNSYLRADSEHNDASSAGFSTPPPGTATPLGVNGIHGSGALRSQLDVMEVDGLGNSVIGSTQEDLDEDDAEFKTWKQITKKDRAMAAAERNRLFRGDQLNPDEPALLRSKAGMRRWMRQQKLLSEKPSQDAEAGPDDPDAGGTAQGESLAEGIEEDEDSTLPDYYNPLSHIPDMHERWKWVTDSEGYVMSQNEQYLRIFPKELYKSTEGTLTKKMEGNMRQMQETRKICAKIGIVKQMQIQAQTYQNQFQKYDPEPFVEADVGPVVVSEEGPLMAPWVNRAALQRSVGKIFYHAGFEDFQPAALDTITDLASEFFTKLTVGLTTYREQPRVATDQPRFTFEEQVLHTLQENGHELEDLEMYVNDDVDRLGTKLGVVHERMKAHLADLLRPALGEHAGADGAGAFYDGSQQFVGGDFAEDIDEDFFGFRELGLADELGLESLSVPLHLLQNRLHSGYQAQNQGPVTSIGITFQDPPKYEQVSLETLPNQPGIVQPFFLERLRKNRDEPLVEDEDLPQKQRFPKPRLPPTGKISSPRKRPLREQQQAAKKKRKLEEDSKMGKPMPPLKLQMPQSKDTVGDPEKDGGQGEGAMMSPESLTAS